MKFKLDNYKVGELAEFYGVSVETIRFYEKVGIVNPLRNEENNYRSYSKEEVISLDYIMKLREMDFSIDEIKGILKKDKLADLYDAIGEKEEKIKEEIQVLEEKLSTLRTYKEKINQCLHRTGKVEVIEDMSFVIKNIDSSLKKSLDALKNWTFLEMPAFTIMADPELLASDESLLDRKNRSEQCEYVVLAEDYGNCYNEEKCRERGAYCYRASKVVHTVISVHTNKEYKEFIDLYNSVKKKYNVLSTVFIKFLAMETTREDGIEFVEVWMPVEEKE